MSHHKHPPQHCTVHELLRNIFPSHISIRLRIYHSVEPRFAFPHFPQALLMKNPSNVWHQLHSLRVRSDYLCGCVIVQVSGFFRVWGLIPEEMSSIPQENCIIQASVLAVLLKMVMKPGTKQERFLQFVQSLLLFLYSLSFRIARNNYQSCQWLQSFLSRRIVNCWTELLSVL